MLYVVDKCVQWFFFIVSLMYCIILPLSHVKWGNTLISEFPIPVNRYVFCMFSILWGNTKLFSEVQFSSVALSCPTLCDPMNHSMPGFPVYHQLPEFTQTHAHWVHDAINHLIFCHSLPLLPLFLPSIRVFSYESTLHMRWPKYWSFSFNIRPSSEHPGLISFRVNWLDLLAVQGTLKSLLQHHSSKASVLWRSAFFIVQLSHPYMTTGKTIALTRWTFVGKVKVLICCLGWS